MGGFIDIDLCRSRLESQLMACASDEGHWRGRLSSSALATSVAVVALAEVGGSEEFERVRAGIRWLQLHANSDGGWGDSPSSRSNLSTTLLAWAAQEHLGRRVASDTHTLVRAERWLRSRMGSLDSTSIATSVLSFYGNDRTFSAPILLMLAVCDCLGRRGWSQVPQLPMEIAAFPKRFFRWVRLPVVSYAVPALIAVGLARHNQLPSRVAPIRWLRKRLTPYLLGRLQRLQPSNGGFLEATPLTAFVLMSLAAAGFREHPVAIAGARFLRESQREDGSWPIDSDLATWVTTLAVKSLCEESEDVSALPRDRADRIRSWLIEQQLEDVHPFTGAEPGGWAWTDLPGGVPDADDTAGALLALKALDDGEETTRRAASRGVRWLLGLQNGDGGLPTFCKGWGRLPFDRSCPDITAHALRAWVGWRDNLDAELARRVDGAVEKGLGFLRADQRDDGSWLPLWFGNQWGRSELNPVYGTALVVDALRDSPVAAREDVVRMRRLAESWLLQAQNPDGGWGLDERGNSTFEETALAITALAEADDGTAVDLGIRWLLQALSEPNAPKAEPIGLYFASLWYSEQLYPLVFGIKALRRVASVRAARARRLEGVA